MKDIGRVKVKGKMRKKRIQPEKQNRVYCINCKWIERTDDSNDPGSTRWLLCNHPNNMKPFHMPDDYYEPSEYDTMHHDKEPNSLNRFNSCEWYEEKKL